MTTVNVSPGLTEPTHDISLTDGTNTYGFLFASGPRILQEIPMSAPAKNFNITQVGWIGGRGRVNHKDDPTGFADSQALWTTSDRKVFQNLQWRFAKGLRVANEDLPDGSETYAWWGLYGTANSTTRIGRYLSRSFTATAQTADKGYLWIRRRGTPGTLTFELCSDTTGSPGTVLQTVTKTVSDITDTISVFQLFDWTGTEALTGAATYHVKVYGASTDTSTNHWEVLGDTAGTGKMSSAGSSWTSSSFAPYFRIVDADTARRWWFFDLDGCMYAVSQRDNLTTASDLFTFGVRGTATSATGTTLVDTNLTIVADQWIGAYIRIMDGTGDGQVRVITDNDTNSFTVATWDKNPDATSQYVVYSSPYLTTTTGTSGLGVVTGRPASAARAAYFPQGAAVAPRYMVVAATSHTFAADGTNYADLYYTYTDPTAGVKIARALTNTANFKNAPATGGALTFANEITIGTTDYRITNMYEWDGVLYIFKEDGLFYFDGTKVYRVGNSFSDAPDADNGVAVGTFNKNLWFGWSHSIQRMIGADAEDMLNFKFGYEGLPADRRGTISAIVSGVGWLFVAIDGGASNYSSVLCYSGYGWHEIFRGWATGVRIRNLAWQPCPGTRSKLWIDINGEMVYIEFPKECANPTKDTTLPYQHEGVLTTATIDAGDPTFYKIFHELKVLTEELSTVGTIEVDYQTNESVGTSTWTVLGTIDDSPSESITMDYGSVYQIRFRFRFQTKASVTPTVMTAWETNGWETELLKYQFIPSFRVSTEQDTKTGETDHNPNTMITWLKTVSSTLTKLTMRSLNSSMDNKVVFVSAPAISRDYVDEDAWGGRLSFVIREV